MKAFIIYIFTCLWLINPTKGQEVESYVWDYQEKKFNLSLAFDASTQDECFKEAKQVLAECVKGSASVQNGTDATDLLDVNFRLHTDNLEKNSIIQQAVKAFKKIALDSNLNDNQLAELVIAFVQKAINLSPKSSKLMRSADSNNLSICGFVVSPSFTLYLKQGSVQDKSLLAFVLLEKLGYNVFLKYFAWENERGLPAVRHFGVFLIPTYESLEKSTVDYVDIYAEVYHKNIPLGHRLKLTQNWQVVFKSTAEINSPNSEANQIYRLVWEGVVLSAIDCSRKNYILNP